MKYLDDYNYEELKSIVSKLVTKRNKSKFESQFESYNSDISSLIASIHELSNLSVRQHSDLVGRLKSVCKTPNFKFSNFMDEVVEKTSYYDYLNTRHDVLKLKYIVLELVEIRILKKKIEINRVNGLRYNVDDLIYNSTSQLTTIEIACLKDIREICTRLKPY